MVRPIRIEFDGQALHTCGSALTGFQGLPENVPLTLGVRPEHLQHRDEGQFEITLDLVEKLGADNLIYGSLRGDGNAGESAELCLRTSGTKRHQPGEKMKLWFDTAQSIVFHTDSGERIL